MKKKKPTKKELKELEKKIVIARLKEIPDGKKLSIIKINYPIENNRDN